MIDVRRLREDRPTLTIELARKGISAEVVNAAATADERWRRLQAAVDDLRHRRNAGSADLAKVGGQDRGLLLERMRMLSEELDRAESAARGARAQARRLLISLPNPAAPEAPDGAEEDYRVVKTVGTQTALGIGQADHAALGGPARLLGHRPGRQGERLALRLSPPCQDAPGTGPHSSGARSVELTRGG